MEVANDLASLFFASLDPSRLGRLALAAQNVVSEAVPVVIAGAAADPLPHLLEVVRQPVRHVDAKCITGRGDGPVQCRPAAVLQGTAEWMLNLPQCLDLVGEDCLLI